MRVLVVTLLTLVVFTCQARAQCGPGGTKPYPPGTTTCPAGPSRPGGGTAPAPGGTDTSSGTLCSQDSPVGSYAEVSARAVQVQHISLTPR